MPMKYLDLTLLQAFTAVIDSGSFTLAARYLCRTQSAVSMQIRKLEETVGRALLQPDRRPQAAAELEKAGGGDKPDGAVLEHLGDTYSKLGLRDKAVATWRKAAEAFRQEKETDKAKAVEKKIPEK